MIGEYLASVGMLLGVIVFGGIIGVCLGLIVVQVLDHAPKWVGVTLFWVLLCGIVFGLPWLFVLDGKGA